MKSMLRKFRLFGTALVLATLAPVAGWAASLDEAKSGGWVCEQMDGYLRLAKAGAPGDIQNLVNSINNQRRAEYARIAQKNGVAPDQVAKIAANKVRQRQPQHACR